MELVDFSSLWRLVLFFLPFIFIQRWLHHELQRVIYLLTRSRRVVIFVFSTLFFPGILLHEISHYAAARLLGVRTGRISLKPGLQPDGTLRMGFVEVQDVEFFRNALIGAAPLITGGIVISIIGMWLFDNSGLVEQPGLTLALVWESLNFLLSAPAFWFSLYLLVSISSMMLPSESDRRDWLALVLFFGVLGGLFYLMGLWGWFAPFLIHWVNRFFDAAGLVFGISLSIHILFLVPVYLLRIVFSRILRRSFV